MRQFDWQMLLFVGTSLAHDYWIIWGLPSVYFWDVKRKNIKQINENDDDEINAA
ncbi:hypothetical protein [Virgibacillus profundi]|uniref:hypothetical protein n=1 Tax=Virgibacillus profundi TaxID=2024555 RepID=UPI0013FDCFAC|nr:hypothetical protein [Virgibacillus profundi]